MAWRITGPSIASLILDRKLGRAPDQVIAAQALEIAALKEWNYEHQQEIKRLTQIIDDVSALVLHS